MAASIFFFKWYPHTDTWEGISVYISAHKIRGNRKIYRLVRQKETENESIWIVFGFSKSKKRGRSYWALGKDKRYLTNVVVLDSKYSPYFEYLVWWICRCYVVQEIHGGFNTPALGVVKFGFRYLVLTRIYVLREISKIQLKVDGNCISPVTGVEWTVWMLFLWMVERMLGARWLE